MRLERVFTHRLIRSLRAVLPILVAVLVAIPAWNYLSRRAQQPQTSAEPRQLPGDLAVRTEGFTFSRTDGGRTLFTIRAKNNLGFKDNRNMLEDVDVIVYGATEKEPAKRIRSQRCSYDQETGDIRFEGQVEVQLDEHTTAHSEELTYNHRGRIVASSRKTFIEQPGSMSGHANSVEYALDSGLLKLNGDVQVQTAEQTSMETGSAVFNQKENWTMMAGGVFIQSETGWIRGAAGRADLEPSTYKPKTVTIDGDVTGQLRTRGGLNSWTLHSNWIEAAISPAGAAERVKTRGDVVVEEFGGGGRRLSGGEIDATLNAAGRVEILEARQNARMTLGLERTLSANQIWSNAAGSVETTENSVLVMGESRIEGRQFTINQGDVITFSTTSRAILKSGQQESEADETRARFDSRTNTLVELVQKGAFRFKDSNYEGSAQNAKFEEGGTLVTLDGSPVVTDSEKRLEASEIRLDRKTNSFVATKNVRTFFKNSAEPVFVKAARACRGASRECEVEGGAGALLYTGNVELWRGEAYIKSERIEAATVGKTNRLRASGKVSSNFNNVRVTAGKLDYDDERGVAHYTGNVQARKQDMILDTPGLTVTFSGNQVAEIAASGGVVVTQGGRRGTGESAAYAAATDTVTLTGNPAQITDKARGSSEGARLTMKTKGETAVAEGGNGKRTVTRHTVKR